MGNERNGRGEIWDSMLSSGFADMIAFIMDTATPEQYEAFVAERRSREAKADAQAATAQAEAIARGEREMVACHECGQTVPSDTCDEVTELLGRGKYYSCRAHGRERAATDRQELAGIVAREGQLVEVSLLLSAEPGKAPAWQVRVAVEHLEAYTRAAYALLRDKAQRAYDVEYGEDDEVDVADIGDVEDYLDNEYETELERLLNTVVNDLARARRLSDPLYTPGRLGATEYDTMRMVGDAIEKHQQTRALEEWKRQQRQEP